MKASELRIGNYLLTPDRHIENEQPGYVSDYAQVQQLRFKGCTYIVYYSDKGYVQSNELYEDLSPIPMTEEWLIKLGFKQTTHLFEHPDPADPELASKDSGTKYPSFFFNNRLNRWMDCQTRVCVDHVHQLQNLYYALTYEELTLKQQ